jgi:flagellar hook-associated protein 2
MAVSTTNAASATSVLDVPSLVRGLMQVENLALTKIDNRIGAVNTKVSALGSFMSKASALKDALDTLGTASRFTARTTTSSDSGLVTVAATSSASAATLSVVVKQSALAQQSLVSGFSSATASVSEAPGTFSLTNTASGVATPVAVTAGMTLAQLASAINASNAGVSAAVVQQTDTGFSLLLTGKSVGVAQAFTTAFTPTDGTEGELAGTTTTRPQAAADAAVRVNGIDYTRASNTFSDILPGVTLTLNKPVSAADWASASSASVGVSTSNANAATAVNAVVTAYNEAHTLYRSLTRNNTDAALRGPLSGDQTLHNYMAKVRSMIDGGFNDTAGNNVRFFNAGITTAADGTLKVDSAELKTALDGTLGTILANGTSVRTPSSTESLLAFTRSSLVTGGLLAGSRSSGQSQADTLSTQRDTLSGRLVSKQARYTAQYARLDAMLTSMQQTSSALSGALDALKAQREAK